MSITKFVMGFHKLTKDLYNIKNSLLYKWVLFVEFYLYFNLFTVCCKKSDTKNKLPESIYIMSLLVEAYKLSS